MNVNTATGFVAAYGCPPSWDPPQPIMPPLDNPWWPGFVPKRTEFTGIATLEVCSRCGCHSRIGEPCVVCLKADLVALEKKVDAALEELKKSQPKPKKKGKK